MTCEGRIVQTLERLPLGEEEIQDLPESSQREQGGGVAQDEIQASPVSLVVGQALHVKLRLLQRAHRFFVGIQGGCSAGEKGQILDRLLPKLELVVEARARLIRVRDGFVLFSRPYDHVGSSHTFMEWTGEGARVYREARAATLEKLGAAIAADFLGPFPPPEVAPMEPRQECLCPDPT